MFTVAIKTASGLVHLHGIYETLDSAVHAVEEHASTIVESRNESDLLADQVMAHRSFRNICHIRKVATGEEVFKISVKRIIT